MDTPAVVGIKNHGNTCFMNSVLQCLSNIDYLAEYFVADYYKIDRKKHVKIHSKNQGTRGEVTDQLSLLLKSLWGNRPSTEISFKWKTIVARHGPQYEGCDQHDAQEFLLWLLDKTHEELNVALKSRTAHPMREASSSFSNSSPSHRKTLQCDRSDDELASETLRNHLQYNHSFIHELFQAQLKSSLTCHSCGKISNTFDPFLCLSIPVPSAPLQSLLVTTSFLDRHPREIRLRISVESRATVRDIRDRISRQIRVPEKQLVLLRLDQENGMKELNNDSLLIQDLVSDLKEVLAIETPKLEDNDDRPLLLFDSQEDCHPPPVPPESIALVLVNRLVSSGLFGPLFSCRVRRDISYRGLQRIIFNTICEEVVRRECHDYPISESTFRLRVVTGGGGRQAFLPTDVDHPLFTPAVDDALFLTGKETHRGPPHVMIIIEWKSDTRHKILVPDDDLPLPIDDHSVFMTDRYETRISLIDCLDLYFREERLSPEDAWMCPSCKKKQPSLKKLSLWSLPDILIVHLKRFRQTSTSSRAKLTTHVTFPINGLDMTPYLEKKKGVGEEENNYTIHSRLESSLTLDTGNTSPTQWNQPWKRPSLRLDKCNGTATFETGKLDGIYDLISVSNHSGSLSSGHYTAFCMNPVDKRWYCFDDSSVSRIHERHVITPNAYILFYQRRSLTSPCPSSGYSGSSSLDLHWFQRLNKKDFKSLSAFSPLLGRKSRDRERRKSYSYATLPAASKTARTLVRLFRGGSRSSVRRSDHPSKGWIPPSSPSQRSSSVSAISSRRTPLECSTFMRVILPEEESNNNNNRHTNNSNLIINNSTMKNEASPRESITSGGSSSSSSGQYCSSRSPVDQGEDEEEERSSCIEESKSCWTVTSV